MQTADEFSVEDVARWHEEQLRAVGMLDGSQDCFGKEPINIG